MNKNIVISDCRNEALKKVLQMKNIEISSDMIFGIGDGFDLSIVRGKLKHIEYLMLLGRNIKCEENVLNRLNIEYASFDSDESSEILSDSMKKEIDNGNGVFVELDRFYLSYLPIRKAHFGMHAIAVMGYDDDKKVVKVYDSLLDEIQEISYCDLNAAMHEDLDIFKPSGTFISVRDQSINKIIEYKEIKKYMIQSCKKVADKYNDVQLIIKSKLNEFNSIKNEKVRNALLNFQIDYICQLILEEEPSKSLYRKVYASFIHNLAVKYNDEKLEDFSQQFRSDGDEWTNLAISCHNINNCREKYIFFSNKLENIFLNEKLILDQLIKYLE